MKRNVLVLILSVAVASPAFAFLNPRTVAFWSETSKGSGVGKLHIDVVGGAWRCIGGVRVVDGQLPAQNLNMECAGMARSAVATISEDGQFRRIVRYKLDIGIKGHLTLM